MAAPSTWDLLRCFGRTYFVNAAYNPRGLQNIGQIFALEPVLAVIPYRDRMSQLAAMSDRLEQYFLQRPQGAWLTERVRRTPAGDTFFVSERRQPLNRRTA